LDRKNCGNQDLSDKRRQKEGSKNRHDINLACKSWFSTLFGAANITNFEYAPPRAEERV